MGLGRPAIWAFALGFGLGIGQANSLASLTLLARQIAAVEGAANYDRIPTVAILLDDAAGVSPTTLRKTRGYCDGCIPSGWCPGPLDQLLVLRSRASRSTRLPVESGCPHGHCKSPSRRGVPAVGRVLSTDSAFAWTRTSIF